MEDRVFPFVIKERMLPGRVHTRALADWNEDSHGIICTGCNEVVGHLMQPCECPEWKEWSERNANARRL